MSDCIQIDVISPSDPRLERLAVQARAEGYRFVDRLLSDAKAGVNLFDKDGEIFFGAVLDGTLVGCGGVNLDPYAEHVVGRLRHIFVAHDVRRRGIATALVNRLLEASFKHFDQVRLRTPDRRADLFYEAIGFVPVVECNATHVMRP